MTTRPPPTAIPTAILTARSAGAARALVPVVRHCLAETGARVAVIIVDHSVAGGAAKVFCAAFGPSIATGSLRLISVDHCPVWDALNAALDEVRDGLVIYPGAAPAPVWDAAALSALRQSFADAPDAEVAVRGPVGADGRPGGPITRHDLAHRAVIRGRPARFFPDPEGLEATGFVLRHSHGPCLSLNPEATARPPAPPPAAREARYLANLTRAYSGSAPPRIALKCPAPDAARAHLWGDFHLAQSLARALRDLGCIVRVDLADAWHGPDSEADDVAVLLRGVRRYRTRPHQINMMWLISHPDRVTASELDRYDHVFVASALHTRTLAALAPGRVSELLQCSDPARFGPGTPAPADTPAHPLLFVGNSRGSDRWVLSAALEQGRDVAVYGTGWDGRLPPGSVRGSHVPNERLGTLYHAAGIVLNDHWPDMARAGFASNRLFDVALAGGFVISDRVAGPDVFGGALVTVRDARDLAAAIDHWQAHPAARRARARRLHEIGHAAHTVGHRARVMLREIDRARAARS